jgi:hypothetical protein
MVPCGAGLVARAMPARSLCIGAQSRLAGRAFAQVLRSHVAEVPSADITPLRRANRVDALERCAAVKQTITENGKALGLTS